MLKKSTFLRLFSFMGWSVLPYLVGVFFLAVIALATQIVLATMFKDMFNAIAIQDYSTMVIAVRNFGIILMFIYVLRPFFNYMAQAAAARNTGNIRKVVLDKIQSLPLGYVRKGHSGDLISRLTNDIGEAEKAYANFFLQFAVRIVTGIGTTVYTFMLDWRLALLAVSGGVLTLVINLYYARILKNISTEVQKRLATLTERLSDLLAGIRVVKTFNLGKIIYNKYEEKNQDVLDTSLERVNKKAVIATLNSLVGLISFGGVAVAGSYLAINGIIQVGIIIAVVQLQNGINMLVRGLGDFLSELQASLAAADRIFEVLDAEEEPESYDLQPVESTINAGSHKEGNKTDENVAVAFHNVSFSYDGEEKVLEDLSFAVPKGKVYALAGSSGGGKSTIFKLIMNFYPPGKGDIKIDGRSIAYQSISRIREKIAYVPQNAYLFSGTIAENIRYGREGASKREIIRAAMMANAHDFIMELEDGYDTKVGERGAQLSGGQRQRIAIARAILKDAPILLLDEATSSLDTESEYLVQEALSELMKGRTTLVIAHRLATIQDADCILVLSRGRIVEKGTHEELLADRGIYFQLYQQQFTNGEGDTEKVIS